MFDYIILTWFKTRISVEPGTLYYIDLMSNKNCELYYYYF